MKDKPRILFLCTGNSCRSQMAEGFCRELHGEVFHCSSAGLEIHGLNPRAVKVMAEVGVDISEHSSKTVDDLKGAPFDYVITVCGHASETCPWFPGGTAVLHRGFEDPPRLTREMESEEDILNVYRRVRDEIGNWVRDLPKTLPPRRP